MINSKDIIDFENKYDFFKSPDSPSLIVGFGYQKILKKHKVPMLHYPMHLTKRTYTILKKVLNYLDKKNDFKIEAVLNQK